MPYEPSCHGCCRTAPATRDGRTDAHPGACPGSIPAEQARPVPDDGGNTSYFTDRDSPSAALRAPSPRRIRSAVRSWAACDGGRRGRERHGGRARQWSVGGRAAHRRPLQQLAAVRPHDYDTAAATLALHDRARYSESETVVLPHACRIKG
ncbi:hypothetical protein GCM10010421_09860 [Streptomyces glaucus]|uniref:Uncharacterized protein n=1 Tax=Streptomyces glaucus TaxID=284029 RepID=A0ABN3JAS3_9ACTN